MEATWVRASFIADQAIIVELCMHACIPQQFSMSSSPGASVEITGTVA